VQLKISKRLQSCGAAEAVELLAVNANEVAEIAASAQDGMENIMQPGKIRAVRNRYQPDNHRTNVAQNSS
jgi:hypothetical protein